MDDPLSEDYRTTIEDLLVHCEVEPLESPARVALAEEAVRLADHHRDEEHGYLARQSLVEAAIFAGQPEKAMVAFAWCLAVADRAPDDHNWLELLWHYKWILDSLAAFPQITRQQIETSHDDFERRAARLGMGRRAALKLRAHAARDMGDVEQALAYQALWRDAAADAFTDCPACEQHDAVDWLVFEGDDDEAYVAALPILVGLMECAEVPHRTLALLLLPLLRMDRREEALRRHRQGYRLVRGNRKLLREAAHHLAFLALTGNLDAAGMVLRRHLGWALDSRDLAQRLDFLLASRLLVARLDDDPEPLRLPRGLPLADEQATAPALAEWLQSEIDALTARFDARNGNDSVSRRAAAHADLLELARDWPLG